MSELGEFYYEIARNELRETEVRKQQSLEQFREWLRKHPFIKNVQITDTYILGYLRSRKYAMDRAFESFEKMMIAIKMHPEWFDLSTDQFTNATELYKSGYASMLKRDANGRRQIITKVSMMDPKKFIFNDLLRLHMLLFSFLTIEPESQICGPILTYDFSNLTMEQLAVFSPKIFIEMTDILAFIPMRPCKLNFIGLPKFALTMFEIAKSFLTEKIKNRVVIYDKNELQYAPDDVEDIKDFIYEITNFYDELKNIEIDDEHLRVCGEHESYGSFRKLEID